MFKKYCNAFLGFRLIKNKVSVFFHLFGIGPQKLVYHLKNGVQLAVPKGKRHRSTLLTIREIFKDKIYSPSIDAQVILDIGAQCGLFSIYAAKLCPSATIYAFEPDRENIEQVLDNLVLNQLEDRVVFISKAITSKTGTTQFNLNLKSSRANSLAYHEDNYVEKITIETISLADFFKQQSIEQVDYLKMDIEGGEYDILFSLGKEEFSKIQEVQMEYHPLKETPISELKEKIIQVFQSHQFQREQKQEKEEILVFKKTKI